VNARTRWQALQARLTAARTALEAGNRDQALSEVTAALDLDPNFLAAISLRDSILTSNADPTTKTLQNLQNPLPETPNPLPGAVRRPLVSTEGYAKFEQRARRRRVDRRIEAARAAIANRRLREAASALDEVIELDPNLPELTELTAAFDELRKSGKRRRRLGPAIAAAAAFVAVVLGASWLHDRDVLLSYPMAAIAALVEARTPEPVVTTIIDDVVPVTTSGDRDRHPQSIERRVAVEPPVRPMPEPPRAPAIAMTNAVTNPVTNAVTNTAPVPLPPPSQQPPSQPQPATVVAQPQLQQSMMVPPSRPNPTLPPMLPVVPAVQTDEVQIKQALQRYRSAYEGLDARSARAVYPAVNEAALARAFDGLESQTLTFEACDVQMHGEGATAICHGSARYVPKIGSREPRIEPRNWTFALRKAGTDWKIESARAQR
jgi:tetratricopeptide (TPR) repeat protein